jgi:hypothetical protein
MKWDGVKLVRTMANTTNNGPNRVVLTWVLLNAYIATGVPQDDTAEVRAIVQFNPDGNTRQNMKGRAENSVP